MTARRYAALLAAISLAAVMAAGSWTVIPPRAIEVALAAPAPRPAGGLPWLSTAGRRIVDPEGRSVLLRGFNDDALLDYPWRRPPPLDETDAELMHRAGFDVVRLPISWSRIEPRRGLIDGAYVGQVAAAVAMLERHGLYTVLDMHFLPGWGEAFGAPGAPAWAQAGDVPNVNWARIDPFGKDTNPAEMAAEVHFWSSPDWQADFELAWRAIARALAGDPGLAGYDLYNEPHPFPIPPRLFEQWYMWPLFARTIAAIGEVDPNHLFFVESTLFGDSPTAMVPLHARDLVYSPHLYTGALVPGVLSPGPHPLQDSVAERRREAAILPAALWFGELGIQHSKPDAGSWTETAIDELDAAGIGWAWWQWRQDGGWGIRAEDGGSLDLPFLRRLARPYLRAAAPGVRGVDGGSSGRLSVETPARPAPTTFVVAWPGLLFSPPAASSSCAAVSRYDADASTLTIEVPAGPACDITVRPS